MVDERLGEAGKVLFGDAVKKMDEASAKKYCYQCKFFIHKVPPEYNVYAVARSPVPQPSTVHTCSHEAGRNIVDGAYSPCDIMRMGGKSSCGPEGRFYEEASVPDSNSVGQSPGGS